jgi:hypothetical protein
MRPYFGARSWKPNTGWLPWRGTAAGGGYSTVGDIARFADALTGHKLLSPASTELLLAGKIDFGYGSDTRPDSSTAETRAETAGSGMGAERRA